MEIKRAVTLFFSPTGATRKTVQAVAQGLGAPETLELDRTAFDSRWTGAELRPGDVAVLGVPVYGGRTPALMDEFFRCIQAKDIPAVLVVTYGNRAFDDALLELKDESLRHGFLPVAAGAFIGRHSFTEKLGTGRPNEDDLARAAALGRDAAALLAKHDPASLTLEVPGSFPYTPRSDLPIAPSTDGEKCVCCGLCQKNCPVQAIDPADPGSIDGWRCLTCARCIQSCPTGAKYIGIPAMREKIAILEAMFAQPQQPQVFLAQ